MRDLSQLAERRFDLLVIGGGIVGAGIANEAAQAGLAVALVDRGDFGGATSSASSKLIHGGLRYLRLGDVKLVREAHRERRALLKTCAAPRPRLPSFLLYRDGLPADDAQVQLALYSGLAGDRSRLLPRARQSVPDLAEDRLRGCGVVRDSFRRRAALSRQRPGDSCRRRRRCELRRGGRLRQVEGRVRGEGRDRLSGETVSVEAGAVVNATAWITAFAFEDPPQPPLARLSKGVHRCSSSTGRGRPR